MRGGRVDPRQVPNLGELQRQSMGRDQLMVNLGTAMDEVRRA